MDKNIKIVLLGLDFSSGNLGCAALAYAFLDILEEICKKRETYFDIISVNYHDAHIKRKYLEVKTVKICYRRISFYKDFYKSINQANLVIDFTGGDSFTDMYGLKRFITETMLKQVVIINKKPLIIGPQTLGPFKYYFTKSWAKKVLGKCELVFTRDQLSYEYAKKDLNCKSILTTDVAFSLSSDQKFKEWKKASSTRIGINVSGLMWNGGYTGKNEFGLSLDYQSYCKKIINKLLENKCEVHLIAHVISKDECNQEDDYFIAKLLNSEFPETILAPTFENPMQAKAYMSGMDFFIGSRMHATIGAFSMKVPTVSVSYSRKFEGLYKSLGYDYIIDAKNINDEAALNLTMKWLKNREKLRDDLDIALNLAKLKNKEFINQVENFIFDNKK